MQIKVAEETRRISSPQKAASTDLMPNAEAMLGPIADSDVPRTAHAHACLEQQPGQPRLVVCSSLYLADYPTLSGGQSTTLPSGAQVPES